jgi:hypothetical protein
LTPSRQSSSSEWAQHVGGYRNTSEIQKLGYEYDILWAKTNERPYGHMKVDEKQCYLVSKLPKPTATLLCLCLRYLEVEREIDAIAPVHNIGALSLSTNNLKLQLKNESRAWQFQYASKLHSQARDRMSSLLEYIRVTTNKLNREVRASSGVADIVIVCIKTFIHSGSLPTSSTER